MISNDKEHFYSYSKEFLSGAFPMVNEAQVHMKEKAESESRWLTKNGFDKMGKRTNWNEHPRKPDPAKLTELRYPYVKQSLETKASLAKKMYRPQDEGKPIFAEVGNTGKKTFSEQSYFKTVFAATGAEMERQMEQDRRREQEEWEKKVVVANKHFFVNTKTRQQDKMRGILQDQPVKVGLRLS